MAEGRFLRNTILRRLCEVLKVHLHAYVKILRFGNAAMAAGAVFLGAWISSTRLTVSEVISLAIAAFCATGFGNIINDLLDIRTDRICHPDRPLPSGTMRPAEAFLYGLFLAATSLGLSYTVSPRFGTATAAPLAVLVAYALLLKSTPLAGNAVVSIMVAYSLVYGGIGSPDFALLVVPAILAMLLNFSREIVKDIQDDPGDRTAGLTTSAMLSRALLYRILIADSVLYFALLFVPCLRGRCGLPYAGTVIAVTIPLHARRLWLMKSPDWSGRARLISSLIKIEMLSGLLALALDRLLRH